MSSTTWKLVLSTLLYLTSARAQDGQRFTLSFSISDPVEQCGETAIGYTLSPELSTVLPIELTIGVQDTDDSNFFQLTTDADLGNFTWTWNPVNMTTGQYRIIAADTANTYGIHGISSPFSIQAGDSTACLTSTGGGSGTNSSSSLTSSLPNETASNTSPTNSSPTSAPDNTAAAASTSSGSHLSTGATAGIAVAGALILIAGLAALYWFLVARRRQSRYPSSSSPKGHSPFGDDAAVKTGSTTVGGTGRWNNLASVDDHEGKIQTTPGYGYGAAAAERNRSFGSISGNNVSHSSGGEFVEKNGYNGYPPSSPAADLGDGAAYDGVAYLPPVTMYDRRSPTQALTSPMARTTSASSSQSRRSVHGSAYPPSVPEDVAVTTPNTPIAPTMGLGLVAGDAARRSKGATTRKPVPSYAGGEDETQSSSQSPSSADPNRSSYIDPFASRQSSVSSSSEHLQAAHPSPIADRELTHKSSFGEGTGGKPMQHVLMPDLPAPQRVSSPPIRM